MLKETLIEIFERDLNRLKEEINSYQDEHNLWLAKGSVKNSAGNLCLHVVGNLNHFIGAVLGNTDYIRNREKELNDKHIPKDALISRIDNVIEVINQTLGNLKQDDYDKVYPINVFGNEMTTQFFLIHLTTHVNYHLGQINYHRRLLDK